MPVLFSNIGARLGEIHDEIYGRNADENIVKQWERLSKVTKEADCKHDIYSPIEDFSICKKCHKINPKE